MIEKIKMFLYRISMGYSLLRFQFTINIVNPCNRKCKFCPNHAPEITLEEPWGWYQGWWKAQPNYMSVDKFADFIRRMGFWRFFVRQLSFTGRGETLLHKDILGFCDVAEKYGIKFHITTNGDKLTEELEYALSMYRHLNYVRVSLFEPERYEYWKDRAKKSSIPIRIQNVTQYHIKGLEDGYISTNNAGTEKYSTLPTGFAKDEKYCVAPFSFNTLNTDGTIVTCIAFRELGNAFDQSWWSIWNGKAMREHRKQALKMAIPKHLAFCEDCGYLLGNSINGKKYWSMNKLKNV